MIGKTWNAISVDTMWRMDVEELREALGQAQGYIVKLDSLAEAARGFLNDEYGLDVNCVVLEEAVKELDTPRPEARKEVEEV